MLLLSKILLTDNWCEIYYTKWYCTMVKQKEEEDRLPDLILDLSDNNVINSSKTTNNKFIALSLNCIIMILIAISTATVIATATAIATRQASANQLLLLTSPSPSLTLHTFFSFHLIYHAMRIYSLCILVILRLSNRWLVSLLLPSKLIQFSSVEKHLNGSIECNAMHTK